MGPVATFTATATLVACLALCPPADAEPSPGGATRPAGIGQLGNALYPRRFCLDEAATNGVIDARRASSDGTASEGSYAQPFGALPVRRFVPPRRLALWSLLKTRDSDVFFGVTRSGIVGFHVDLRNVLPTAR